MRRRDPERQDAASRHCSAGRCATHGSALSWRQPAAEPGRPTDRPLEGGTKGANKRCTPSSLSSLRATRHGNHRGRKESVKSVEHARSSDPDREANAGKEGVREAKQKNRPAIFVLFSLFAHSVTAGERRSAAALLWMESSRGSERERGRDADSKERSRGRREKKTLCDTFTRSPFSLPLSLFRLLSPSPPEGVKALALAAHTRLQGAPEAAGRRVKNAGAQRPLPSRVFRSPPHPSSPLQGDSPLTLFSPSVSFSRLSLSVRFCFRCALLAAMAPLFFRSRWLFLLSLFLLLSLPLLSPRPLLSSPSSAPSAMQEDNHDPPLPSAPVTLRLLALSPPIVHPTSPRRPTALTDEPLK